MSKINQYFDNLVERLEKFFFEPESSYAFHNKPKPCGDKLKDECLAVMKRLEIEKERLRYLLSLDEEGRLSSGRGWMHETYVKRILRMSYRGDAMLRAGGIYLLGVYRTGSAIGPLIHAMADREWIIRFAAAAAAGQYDTVRLIGSLWQRLGDENEMVYTVALKSLVQILNRSEPVTDSSAIDSPAAERWEKQAMGGDLLVIADRVIRLFDRHLSG